MEHDETVAPGGGETTIPVADTESISMSAPPPPPELLPGEPGAWPGYAPVPSAQQQPYPQPQPQPMMIPPQGPALPAEAKAPRGRGRGHGRARTFVAVGAAASVLFGAAIGGAVVEHRDNSRNQAVAAFKASQGTQPQPLSAGVRADGSHYGPLFAFLLPVPGDYSLGPDLLGYGDDSYISEQQFSADVNDLFGDLPKSDMTSISGDLTAQHLVGVAVRSMHNSAGSLAVSIVLSQLDAKSAQGEASDYISSFTRLNIFRTGASVPGYPAAKCLLPPGLGSDKLDEMQCVAVSGDVEVMVFAQGTAPLDQTSVVQLLAEQLDRLKSPQTIQ